MLGLPRRVAVNALYESDPGSRETEVIVLSCQLRSRGGTYRETSLSAAAHLRDER